MSEEGEKTGLITVCPPSGERSYPRLLYLAEPLVPRGGFEPPRLNDTSSGSRYGLYFSTACQCQHFTRIGVPYCLLAFSELSYPGIMPVYSRQSAPFYDDERNIPSNGLSLIVAGRRAVSTPLPLVPRAGLEPAATVDMRSGCIPLFQGTLQALPLSYLGIWRSGRDLNPHTLSGY